MNSHLTTHEIEQHLENELDPVRHAEVELHLAACAACRARVAQDARMNLALRALPREQPARDLAARIETRVAQEQARRARLPFIAFATVLALFVALWFCAEFIIALQENGVLDFWTLLTSYSDQFPGEEMDSLIALIEAVPLTELFLALCAFLTVGMLAQQLVESLRPRALQWR
jgi:anti-sigma factor RsiW